MQAHGGKVIGESEIIFPVENNYWKSRHWPYYIHQKLGARNIESNKSLKIDFVILVFETCL